MLNRCQGDIIGTCLSDEELLPDAVARAVEMFRANPDLGAVTCDGYITDETGQETGTFVAGEFDLVNYLFGRYCPFWPGTFFRRQALIDVGLEDGEWSIDALEFEVWCRLGTRHRVKYFPVLMSKYTVHADQLSNTPKNFNEHMNGRIKIIERMFSAEGFAGANRASELACLYNQYFLFYNHARAYKIFDQMEALYGRMMPILKELDPAAWRTQLRGAARRSDALVSCRRPPISRHSASTSADSSHALEMSSAPAIRERLRRRAARLPRTAGSGPESPTAPLSRESTGDRMIRSATTARSWTATPFDSS